MSDLRKWKIRLMYGQRLLDEFLEYNPAEHDKWMVEEDWQTMARQSIHAIAEEEREDEITTR